MEVDEPLDDEEQHLIVIDHDDEEDLTDDVDPIGPEMVAGSSETEPAQGSITPRSAATPDPPNLPETPTVPSLENGFSIDSLRASLDKVLANASDILSTPPEVDSSPIMWENVSLPAPYAVPSNNQTIRTCMLEYIYKNMSTKEKAKMTTELIINCIKEQTPLWDSTDEKFGDAKLCAILWSNIASVCGFDVKRLKAKWNTLRKTYKMEYTKVSESGVPSKRAYFTHMSFLEGEILRELSRENHEKEVAMQQLQRRRVEGGQELFHNAVDGAEQDDDVDDCMIVENESVGQNSICGTSGIPFSTSSKSVPSQPLQSGILKPRNISELQIKRPEGSAKSAANSERKRSPEVICLGETKSKKSAGTHYTAVTGQPAIKFVPIPKMVGDILLEEAMPKTLPTASPSAAVVKQCAKKSISRGNSYVFPGQNGVSAETFGNPVESENVTPSQHKSSGITASTLKTEHDMPWKIESARSMAHDTQKTQLPKEPATNSRDPGCKENSRTTLEAIPHQNETTRKSKDSGVRLENTSLHITPIPPHTEPAKMETSKVPAQNTATLSIKKPPKPEPDDDEIQIIKEVPAASVKPDSTNTVDACPSGPNNQEPCQDQCPPPKKPRRSAEEPTTSKAAANNRKNSKDREYSANRHFLLSLLYDVETLNKRQFRSLKKHTSALVSLILDPR